MNRSIAYGWLSDERPFTLPDKERKIFFTDNKKEAYLYHLETSGVDSYIINCRNKKIVEVQAMIRHIHYLNAIITILLYEADFGVFESLLTNENIHIAKDAAQLSGFLEESKKTGRSTNRIEWPLRADFWESSAKDMKRVKSLVTSISSKGCFLKPEQSNTHKKGDLLSVLFHFRNFDFYAEGRIVRLSDAGLALELLEVSPQTEKYIQEIIDEKILSEIMQMIN